MIKNINTLEELWEYVNELNKKHFSKNELEPIVGGGKINSPKFMFVFINPTMKNISSNKDWIGPRFPFIGTKQVWRIFSEAGLFNKKLMEEIDKNPNWSIGFTNRVLNFLQEKDFYFTNIVKWTVCDATLPDSEKIKLFLPILEREIEIVKPEYIITFGLIPFERLTKQKIKLEDYYSNAIKSSKLRSFEFNLGNVKAKVIPCYFPVGRGNPKKAIEILKLVGRL